MGSDALNKCSILIRSFEKTQLKEVCPNEAVYWMTIGRLGDLDGQTVWLCQEHVDKVFKWELKQ